MSFTEDTEKEALTDGVKVTCPFICFSCARGESREKKFESDFYSEADQLTHHRRRKRAYKAAWVECRAGKDRWGKTVLCCPYEARK